MKTTTSIICPAVALVCFALLQGAQGQVNPPADGCYPNFTTAEGCNALGLLTTGSGNTGVGWYALYADTDGSFNTGVGGGALALNTGESNTAVGAAALLLNTTGFENVGIGTNALVFNDSGLFNNAVGASALYANVNGSSNNVIGDNAMESSTSGSFNTAIGDTALLNDTASNNTAIGAGALLSNTTGAGNIAVGYNAGIGVSTANNVICIGAAGNNFDDSCYIGNIFGATSTSGVGVLINSNGRLGTIPSSRRFKDEIKPMNQASEAILALQPVTFQYKKQIDPEGRRQFGLVAEDVEKVNPDLIVRDKEGRPYSVRYDQVNAMLLNEFLKAHRELETQKAIISNQQNEIAALTRAFQEQAAQIQKIGHQMAVTTSTTQIATNQ